MGQDDTLVALAKTVGELQGTLGQVLATVERLEARIGGLPGVVADHERRLRDLEERHAVTRSWWQHALGPVVNFLIGVMGILAGRLLR